jgi:hypothetical protein
MNFLIHSLCFVIKLILLYNLITHPQLDLLDFLLQEQDSKI